MTLSVFAAHVCAPVLACIVRPAGIQFYVDNTLGTGHEKELFYADSRVRRWHAQATVARWLAGSAGPAVQHMHAQAHDPAACGPCTLHSRCQATPKPFLGATSTPPSQSIHP